MVHLRILAFLNGKGSFVLSERGRTLNFFYYVVKKELLFMLCNIRKKKVAVPLMGPNELLLY